MKTILITGASGFIGGYVFQNLRNDYNLIGLDNNPSQYNGLSSNFTKVDITDKAEIDLVFKKYRPDVVIHCAGIAH